MASFVHRVFAGAVHSDELPPGQGGFHIQRQVSVGKQGHLDGGTHPERGLPSEDEDRSGASTGQAAPRGPWDHEEPEGAAGTPPRASNGRVSLPDTWISDVSLQSTDKKYLSL